MNQKVKESILIGTHFKDLAETRRYPEDKLEVRPSPQNRVQVRVSEFKNVHDSPVGDSHHQYSIRTGRTPWPHKLVVRHPLLHVACALVHHFHILLPNIDLLIPCAKYLIIIYLFIPYARDFDY